MLASYLRNPQPDEFSQYLTRDMAALQGVRPCHRRRCVRNARMPRAVQPIDIAEGGYVMVRPPSLLYCLPSFKYRLDLGRRVPLPIGGPEASAGTRTCRETSMFGPGRPADMKRSTSTLNGMYG